MVYGLVLLGLFLGLWQSGAGAGGKRKGDGIPGPADELQVMRVDEATHDVLTAAIEDAGVRVERSAYGLDTAFAARAGQWSWPSKRLLAYGAATWPVR